MRINLRNSIRLRFMQKTLKNKMTNSCSGYFPGKRREGAGL